MQNELDLYMYISIETIGLTCNERNKGKKSEQLVQIRLLQLQQNLMNIQQLIKFACKIRHFIICSVVCNKPSLIKRIRLSINEFYHLYFVSKGNIDVLAIVGDV